MFRPAQLLFSIQIPTPINIAVIKFFDLLENLAPLNVHWSCTRGARVMHMPVVCLGPTTYSLASW